MRPIVTVELKELPSKHYSTDIKVGFYGHWSTFLISISGDGTAPSLREVKEGWEDDFDMNHVESVEHEYLADLILKTLRKEMDTEV